jgi:hypothetical protein
MNSGVFHRGEVFETCAWIELGTFTVNLTRPFGFRGTEVVGEPNSRGEIFGRRSVGICMVISRCIEQPASGSSNLGLGLVVGVRANSIRRLVVARSPQHIPRCPQNFYRVSAQLKSWFIAERSVVQWKISLQALTLTTRGPSDCNLSVVVYLTELPTVL